MARFFMLQKGSPGTVGEPTLAGLRWVMLVQLSRADEFVGPGVVRIAVYIKSRVGRLPGRSTESRRFGSN